MAHEVTVMASKFPGSRSCGHSSGAVGKRRRLGRQKAGSRNPNKSSHMVLAHINQHRAFKGPSNQHQGTQAKTQSSVNTRQKKVDRKRKIQCTCTRKLISCLDPHYRGIIKWFIGNLKPWAPLEYPYIYTNGSRVWHHQVPSSKPLPARLRYDSEGKLR